MLQLEVIFPSKFYMDQFSRTKNICEIGKCVVKGPQNIFVDIIKGIE